MDKAVVITMAEHGWPYIKIAKKFGISTSRVGQIVKDDKQLTIDSNKGKLLCELCQKVITEKRYFKPDGAKSLLVCEDCEQELVDET